MDHRAVVDWAKFRERLGEVRARERDGRPLKDATSWFLEPSHRVSALAVAPLPYRSFSRTEKDVTLRDARMDLTCLASSSRKISASMISDGNQDLRSQILNIVLKDLQFPRLHKSCHFRNINSHLGKRILCFSLYTPRSMDQRAIAKTEMPPWFRPQSADEAVEIDQAALGNAATLTVCQCPASAPCACWPLFFPPMLPHP